MKLFGTIGIRGTDSFFNETFCIRIGKAFVNYLKEKKYPKKVVFGMDIRESSSLILRAVMTGVQSAGFEIIYG